MGGEDAPVKIGVLALQGSFREHVAALRRLPGVAAAEVRRADELAGVAGLVIPGGESTTMALVAERWGLLPALRDFAAGGRPVWGTCAGLVFLADRAEGQKAGGQPLLGGLDVLVSRNFFGRQSDSFEARLPAPPALREGEGGDAAAGGADTFRAVFIRAPAVLEAGPGVEVLSSITFPPEEAAARRRERVAVAVRSGPLLATSFHPELTSDGRWHELFVRMVRAAAAAGAGAGAAAGGGAAANGGAGTGAPRRGTLPNDMPVYE